MYVTLGRLEQAGLVTSTREAAGRAAGTPDLRPDRRRTGTGRGWLDRRRLAPAGPDELPPQAGRRGGRPPRRPDRPGGRAAPRAGPPASRGAAGGDGRAGRLRRRPPARGRRAPDRGRPHLAGRLRARLGRQGGERGEPGRRPGQALRRGEALVRAVDDVDLEVATGEAVVITGPSGCGKSTLLQLIGGLDLPTPARSGSADSGSTGPPSGPAPGCAATRSASSSRSST